MKNKKVIKIIKSIIIGIVLFLLCINITGKSGFMQIVVMLTVGYLTAIIYTIYYVIFNLRKIKTDIKRLKFNNKKKESYIKKDIIGKGTLLVFGIVLVGMTWFLFACDYYKDIPYYINSDFKIVEGVVTERECKSTKGATDTNFIVNNVKFGIAGDNKDIIEGKTYKIKYLPNSEYIISIVEEMEKGEKEIEYYQ